MIKKDKIQSIISESIKETDYFLVDITVSKDNLIRIYLDHPEGLGLDDCAEFSRLIEEKLDRDMEDFELQVSSPGLGKPLKVFQQYKKNTGRDLDIDLKDGTRLRGKLLSSTESGIVLEVTKVGKSKRKDIPDEALSIDYKDIKSAKVIIEF